MNLLRVGIFVLFVFSVLAMGGVDVWAQSLIEMGAGGLLLIWAILFFRDPDLEIHWSPLYWPLLSFLGIGIAQLIFHETANPFLTRVELLRLSCYFLVFFLTSQAFRSRQDLSTLVWFAILFCFAVSLFGIVQHFTSRDELYGLSQLKIVMGEPFGPFVNRNHFAGFVELTLPLGVGLIAFRGLRKDLFPLLVFLSIVPVSAVILSGSRGGILCLTFEMALLALFAWTKRPRMVNSQGWIATGIVTLVLLALISWLGAEKAIGRFSDLTIHDISLNRRVSMYRGAMRIFLDYPVKGCGLGTLGDVYPRYETIYDGKLIDHVHNDYLEVLAETGLLGAACGMMFLWLLYREARHNFTAEQSQFSRAFHVGAIVSLSGLLIHSMVDFNLHIPANAMLFLLQVSLVIAAPSLSTSGVPGLRNHRIRTANQPLRRDSLTETPG